jgi:hypothetical protein
MAVLRSTLAIAVLAALPACYTPDLRDCTVTCASSADCVGGQVCGGDHYCAAPDVAGTCARLGADAGLSVGDDAPTSHDAARPPDGPPPPPPFVMLHLHVDGHGELDAGGFSCTADCIDHVHNGVPIDIVANATEDQVFVQWTAGPCNGSTSPTCTVTPTMDVMVAAKFGKMGH